MLPQMLFQMSFQTVLNNSLPFVLQTCFKLDLELFENNCLLYMALKFISFYFFYSKQYKIQWYTKQCLKHSVHVKSDNWN